MALADIIESQIRLTEATQLYEKTVNIKRQTGEKVREGNACARLGIIFHKLGENLKAKEYLEKALAITTEIGDKCGGAYCYGNLGAFPQSMVSQMLQNSTTCIFIFNN